MNQHLHRLVFNPARGVLMAVAETAAGRGKASGAEGPNGPRSPPARSARAGRAGLRAVNFAVWCAFALPGAAQIVADPAAPANQRPTVLTAGNGVPLVNIQTPSAAGVSRNTYSQFDVAARGAILNNSRTDVATQLGGFVQGNPWLATGSARVILNEVNSSAPSTLGGFIEVAGQRAQVVVANPACITCDGCGFVNASRVTLTTGTPVVDGGSLDAYRVGGGTVRIDGAGLDARGADFTDVIARAVELNAGLWAQQLRVTTGANEVDAVSGDIRASAAPIAASGAAPTFALDVAALGGMYAGHITLVGTEAGVGVRNAGSLAATGELTLSADGRLTTDIVWLVERSVTLPDGSTRQALVPQVYARARAGDLDGSGALMAGGTLRLRLDGELRNSGVLSGREVVIDTGSRDQVEQTSVLGSSLSAASVGLLAGQDLGVQGSLIEAEREVTVIAARDLAITAAQNTQSASHERQQTTYGLSSPTRLEGRVRTSQTGDAQSLTNQGASITSRNGDVNLVAGRQLGVQASALAAGGDLGLEGAAVVMQGGLDSARSSQHTSERHHGVNLTDLRPSQHIDAHGRAGTEGARTSLAATTLAGQNIVIRATGTGNDDGAIALAGVQARLNPGSQPSTPAASTRRHAMPWSRPWAER